MHLIELPDWGQSVNEWKSDKKRELKLISGIEILNFFTMKCTKLYHWATTVSHAWLS